MYQVAFGSELKWKVVRPSAGQSPHQLTVFRCPLCAIADGNTSSRRMARRPSSSSHGCSSNQNGKETQNDLFLFCEKSIFKKSPGETNSERLDFRSVFQHAAPNLGRKAVEPSLQQVSYCARDRLKHCCGAMVFTIGCMFFSAFHLWNWLSWTVGMNVEMFSVSPSLSPLNMCAIEIHCVRIAFFGASLLMP